MVLNVFSEWIEIVTCRNFKKMVGVSVLSIGVQIKYIGYDSTLEFCGGRLGCRLCLRNPDQHFGTAPYVNW